jgi:hypothetical protein
MSNESTAKLIATNIAKYGSYDKWKEQMKLRAVAGGKKSKRKLTKQQARDMQKKMIQGRTK